MSIVDDITVLDIKPVVDAGSGDTIVFEYQGDQFCLEVWSTDNTSGQDYYWVDSKRAAERKPWNSDDEEDLDAFFQELLDIWFEEYRNTVEPAVKEAAQRAIARATAS